MKFVNVLTAGANRFPTIVSLMLLKINKNKSEE